MRGMTLLTGIGISLQSIDLNRLIIYKKILVLSVCMIFLMSDRNVQFSKDNKMD